MGMLVVLEGVEEKDDGVENWLGAGESVLR